jgi:magnesium-transporting ATPase (P-type)
VLPIGNANIEDAKYISILGQINNEANLEKEKNKWKYYGDSIDVAFLALSQKLETDKVKYKISMEVPYESEKKFSAVFYSKEKEIKSKAFANCKKLKQIIFYEKPEIDKDAFIGCSNLSRITIYGEKNKWEEQELFIPSNPKIEFISTIKNENKKVEASMDIDMKVEILSKEVN